MILEINGHKTEVPETDTLTIASQGTLPLTIYRATHCRCGNAVEPAWVLPGDLPACQVCSLEFRLRCAHTVLLNGVPTNVHDLIPNINDEVFIDFGPYKPLTVNVDQNFLDALRRLQ